MSIHHDYIYWWQSFLIWLLDFYPTPFSDTQCDFFILSAPFVAPALYVILSIKSVDQLLIPCSEKLITWCLSEPNLSIISCWCKHWTLWRQRTSIQSHRFNKSVLKYDLKPDKTSMWSHAWFAANLYSMSLAPRNSNVKLPHTS